MAEVAAPRCCQLAVAAGMITWRAKVSVVVFCI